MNGTTDSSDKWQKMIVTDDSSHMLSCDLLNAACSADEVRWRDYQRGVTSPPPDCGRCGKRIPTNDKPQFMVIISPPAIFNRTCRHGPFCSRCAMKLSRATIPFCGLCRAVSAPSKVAEVCSAASSSVAESYGSKDSGSDFLRTMPKRHRAAALPDSLAVIPSAEFEDKSNPPDISSKMTSLVSKLGANAKVAEVWDLVRQFDLKDARVVQALRQWCQSSHSLSLGIRTRRSLIKTIDDNCPVLVNGQSGTSSSSGASLTLKSPQHINNNSGNASAVSNSATDHACGSNEVRPSSSGVRPYLDSGKGIMDHTPTYSAYIGARKRSREGESSA